LECADTKAAGTAPLSSEFSCVDVNTPENRIGPSFGVKMPEAQSLTQRITMPKCQHCGNAIDGRQIVYRDANKGSRRNHSIRLCHRCADRHDTVASGKKLRNIVMAAVGLGVLVILGGYLLAH
jgi:hypothetical protein